MTRDQKRVSALVKLVQAGDVRGDRKERFHREATWILRTMARMLEIPLSGCKVHSNKAGPAVSGEAILVTEGLYVCVCADWKHLGVLYRKAGKVDVYGVHSENHWLRWDELEESLEVCARRVKHLMRHSERTKAEEKR